MRATTHGLSHRLRMGPFYGPQDPPGALSQGTGHQEFVFPGSGSHESFPGAMSPRRNTLIHQHQNMSRKGIWPMNVLIYAW